MTLFTTPPGGASATAIADPVPAGGAVRARSRVRINVLGIIGLVIIVAVCLFCFAGPLVYHTNQTGSNLAASNLPPGKGHPLGTDNNGFDILGRLMVGGQSSIEIGAAVAVIATSVGVIWGAIAGFTGGLLDSTMMRIVDVILAIPPLFLLLILALGVAAHHPERRRNGHRQRDVPGRRRDLAGSGAELPGAWHPAARHGLGRDALQRHPVRLQQLLVGHLPAGPGDHPRGDLDQLHRRRVA
jgi:hypothetical protein